MSARLPMPARLLLLGAIGSACLLAVMLVTAARAGGYTATISPTSGPEGTQVQVDVTGANPTATICVYYFESVGVLGDLVVMGGVSAEGNATLFFFVPAGTALGPHEVSIHQRFGGCGGAQGQEIDLVFVVTPPTPTPTATTPPPTPTATATTPPPTPTSTLVPTETAPPTATSTTPPTATSTTPPTVTATSTTPPTATSTTPPTVTATSTTPPTATATSTTPPTATATSTTPPTATATATKPPPTKTRVPTSTPTRVAGIQPPAAGGGDGPGSIGGGENVLWVLAAGLGAVALSAGAATMVVKRRRY